MISIVTGYRDDAPLRHSFNDLAGRTFGIDFEPWYQAGFWGKRYDPYSVLDSGRIVANVTVNHMEMMVQGQKRSWIQLGTVMTDPAYRGQGLIRVLMDRIEEEYAGVDGMFLFANDSVLDFYPKFGFRKASEIVYEKKLSPVRGWGMERIFVRGPEEITRLCRAMEESVFSGGCDMLDNPGLMLFYVLNGLSDCVYYNRAQDAWAIAGWQGQDLELMAVFSRNRVSLEDVIGGFYGAEKVTLGFVPEDRSGWQKKILHEQDSTFFIKGKAMADFEERELRIPILGRA